VPLPNDADQLQSLTRQIGTAWEDDASLLVGVRDHVNEMNKLLYDVRANQPEDSPHQQKTIERVTPLHSN
jgi:hypothetical protein